MRIVPVTPRPAKNNPIDRLNDARRILHEIINQLSVVSLYSFKIRSSLRHELEMTARPDSDLKALEHVVEELVQLAERLAKEIGECGAIRTKHSTARANKPQLTAGNVYRLFKS
jgi:hypothetical protein